MVKAGLVKHMAIMSNTKIRHFILMFLSFKEARTGYDWDFQAWQYVSCP